MKINWRAFPRLLLLVFLFVTLIQIADALEVMAYQRWMVYVLGVLIGFSVPFLEDAS